MPEIGKLRQCRTSPIRIAGVSSDQMRMARVQTAVVNWEGEKYEGTYTVTPSHAVQTLPTEGLVMNANITINPIPSNYGRVSWDGAVLTVS